MDASVVATFENLLPVASRLPEESRLCRRRVEPDAGVRGRVKGQADIDG